MKPYVTFLLILLLTACESTEKHKQLSRLTKMIAQTDSLKSVLLQNKIDSVVDYQVQANALMMRLKNNYRPTKIDLNFGRKVNEFKELQMLFILEKEENKRTLPGEFGVVFSSLDEEKMTLNLLKVDVENGRGDKKKYNEFINFEQGKLNTIEGMLEHYLMRKKRYLPRFKKCLQELNEFMDKWEKENKIIGKNKIQRSLTINSDNIG
jgi:hypothetical protein